MSCVFNCWQPRPKGVLRTVHTVAVCHTSRKCPFVLPGNMPEPGDRCPVCGSRYHQGWDCPRRTEGLCPRCKEPWYPMSREHGPGMCNLVVPRCARCDQDGHISALCPTRPPTIVYLCGVCGSEDHLNVTCPIRMAHPSAHTARDDERFAEQEDVTPENWASILPNLPGYLPPVNPPGGGQRAPGEVVPPPGAPGSIEPPPGFPPMGMTYYTEYGQRFHLHNDCTGLRNTHVSVVLMDPFNELNPVSLRLTCCQYCAKRWRKNYPQP